MKESAQESREDRPGEPEEHPAHWLELSDGTPIEVRPVFPDDAPLISEGFEHLSEQSRFSRFMTGVDELSVAQLEYLATVDQDAHIAIGARVEGEPVALARCIRTSNRLEAEVAITVVDPWQRRGIGSLMLKLISLVAVRSGVQRFIFSALATNAAVLRLMEEANAVWEADDHALLNGSADLKGFEFEAGEPVVRLVEDFRSG